MTQSTATGASATGDVASPSGHSKHLPALVLGAFGVVYGDIGTSPIYAFRQAFADRGTPGDLTQDVLGLLSLLVWALTITVSLKYVFIVTRADHKAGGGGRRGGRRGGGAGLRRRQHHAGDLGGVGWRGPRSRAAVADDL